MQMFLIAEGDALMELNATSILEGIVHLMASYYVFDIEYPKSSKPTFHFLQDVIMDKNDGTSRSVRYSTYVKSAGL